MTEELTWQQQPSVNRPGLSAWPLTCLRGFSVLVWESLQTNCERFSRLPQATSTPPPPPSSRSAPGSPQSTPALTPSSDGTPASDLSSSPTPPMDGLRTAMTDPPPFILPLQTDPEGMALQLAALAGRVALMEQHHERGSWFRRHHRGASFGT